MTKLAEFRLVDDEHYEMIKMYDNLLKPENRVLYTMEKIRGYAFVTRSQIVFSEDKETIILNRRDKEEVMK